MRIGVPLQRLVFVAAFTAPLAWALPEKPATGCQQKLRLNLVSRFDPWGENIELALGILNDSPPELVRKQYLEITQALRASLAAEKPKLDAQSQEQLEEALANVEEAWALYLAQRKNPTPAKVAALAVKKSYEAQRQANAWKMGQGMKSLDLAQASNSLQLTQLKNAQGNFLLVIAEDAVHSQKLREHDLGAQAAQEILESFNPATILASYPLNTGGGRMHYYRFPFLNSLRDQHHPFVGFQPEVLDKKSSGADKSYFENSSSTAIAMGDLLVRILPLAGFFIPRTLGFDGLGPAMMGSLLAMIPVALMVPTLQHSSAERLHAGSALDKIIAKVQNQKLLKVALTMLKQKKYSEQYPLVLCVGYMQQTNLIKAFEAQGFKRF